jgi:hypothetical protein
MTEEGCAMAKWKMARNDKEECNAKFIFDCLRRSGLCR